MNTPEISTKEVVTETVVIKVDNNTADLDDVLNVLTVATSSNKPANFFSEQYADACNYLKNVGLIEEKEPNIYAVKDRKGCEELADYLSDTMAKIVKSIKVTSDVSSK